jgi:hypothetical protein
MIDLKNNFFMLSNPYYKYVVGIDNDSKLYHVGFFPDGTSDEQIFRNQRNRLAYPYPFEVLVNTNFEPLQCSHGVRYFCYVYLLRAVFLS